MVMDERGCMHPGDRAQLLDRPRHFQVVAFFHGHDQATFHGDGVDFDTGQLLKLGAHMLCTLRLGVYQQARNVHLFSRETDVDMRVVPAETRILFDLK